MNLYKVEYKYEAYMGRCTRERHIVADDVTDIENILRLNYDALQVVKVQIVEESVLMGERVKGDA